MWRVYMLCSALIAGFAASAADKNLERPVLNPPQSVCEQLLETDLSGFYIVSDLTAKRTTLVEFHQVGRSGAYQVSGARLNLPADGFRRLEFERLQRGWQADGHRVGLLSLDQQGPELFFRFENPHEGDGAALFAAPLYGVPQVRGDILRPDSFLLTFRNGPAAEVRFTRVNLDDNFNRAVTNPLKSLLASRLDGEDPGRLDYVLTVETRRPITSAEARVLLHYDHIVALENEEDLNSRHYKFAIFLPVTGFMESIGSWLRLWEVERFDVVPVHGVGSGVVQSLVERARSRQADEVTTLRTLQESLDAVNRAFGN